MKTKLEEAKSLLTQQYQLQAIYKEAHYVIVDAWELLCHFFGIILLYVYLP